MASAPVVARGVDDRVDAQVALRRRRRPDADRAVRQPDVQRVGVGVAVDGDGLHPRVVTGADDPDGDLAAVGDQDPPERSIAGPVFAQRRHVAAAAQSGMLPCFFGGFVSRLSASISSARISRGRVSDGLITSST